MSVKCNATCFVMLVNVVAVKLETNVLLITQELFQNLRVLSGIVKERIEWFFQVDKMTIFKVSISVNKEIYLVFN